MASNEIKFGVFLCLLLFIGVIAYKNIPRPQQRTYYKCPGRDINTPTIEGLKKVGLSRTLDRPDLYIPCGYNYVEMELAKIKPGTHPYVFAIKGCDALCSKNNLWHILSSKYTHDGAALITPMTWILSDPDGYADFKAYVQQHRATRPVFILKKNIQGKQGLLLTASPDTIDQKKGEYKVVQHYFTRPYTIQGYKLNIRLYCVIVCSSAKPVDWYLYKAGKCIYTNKTYDPETSPYILTDKEQHFTSYNLDTDEKYTQLRLPETLPDLKTLMGAESFDRVWDKTLHKLGLVKRAYAGVLCQDCAPAGSTIYFQLFGLDVILTEDLDPYLLEFNKGPEMVYKSPKDPLLKTQLLEDTLNMVLNGATIDASNFEIII